MSIFSSTRSFFKKLFGKLRPGLNEFLQKYQKIALAEVTKLAEINNNKDFHDWKDTAWNAINSELAADGKKVAGNWVSIITHIAFEEFKQQLAEKAEKEK